jgi:cytochrome c553
VFLCGSIFFDAAPSGGWFMYPPLTAAYQPDIGADIWLLGFSFIEVSAVAAAVELIVGVLKCRPPGMRINLIPLYCWYTLVAASMVLFAFPPLIAGSLLLEVERAAGWPFFDPAGGGDPLLWQHLFWIFGHPEVYIVFLPSVALVAMIVPTLARTPIVGYSWIVLAAVGTGFLSFGLWVHHMFTTGLPGISLGFFSAASEAVAIPTGSSFVGSAELRARRRRGQLLSARCRRRAERDPGDHGNRCRTVAEVAVRLDDDSRRAIATYYEQLPGGAPASSADAASVSRGALIAAKGIPERDVPACVECHGPTDVPKNPAYPRLAGQPARYLRLQLDLLKERRRGGSAHVNLMHEVVDRLRPSDMQAVVDYYSSLGSEPSGQAAPSP